MNQAAKLLVAVKAGNAEQVCALLDADVSLLEAKAEGGVSAISLAVYYGRPEIADLFVARGATLDLFEACATGQTDRVREIIRDEPGAISRFSPDGHSPLGLAAFFGHRAIVDLLIDHGADVNATSRNTMQVAPLHSAAARRDPQIVAVLLDHGADPNAVQQGGFRPIHASAQSGDEASARALATRGADLAAKTDQGKTPADLAREHGHARLADWFEGRDPGT